MSDSPKERMPAWISLFARRDQNRSEVLPRRNIVLLSLALCITTFTLVWLGHITTQLWSRGSDLLAERRQTEALSLVGAALTRDMRGAWSTVIVPMNPLTIDEEPPYNLVQLTASAFARFPYPESFVIWKYSSVGDGTVYAFNRTDRPPSWYVQQVSDDPFPVTFLRDPPAMRQVVRALQREAPRENSYAFLELEINDVRYHVVAHLMFDTKKPAALVGLAAFTVNIGWVRDKYFAPLLDQVGKIGGYEEALSLAVVDDNGIDIAVSGSPPTGTKVREKNFPMTFLDPAVLGKLRSATPTFTEYSVQVRQSDDVTHLAVLRGSRQLFLLMIVAASASVLALLLTIRAIYANALLATMKADFVSSVTHELKTPLALIRLVGDTLSSGRFTSTETIQDYAKLLSQGTVRLGQLIDSLLLSARYSDPVNKGPIELRPIDAGDLIEQSLAFFRPAIERLEFQLEVNVPSDLPPVLVDRTAIIQVMENIVDNAIKYSPDPRDLRITARASGKYVQVTFSDRGTGIPREELTRVFDRFYRGQNATDPGSGLGLAIARGVLQHHGGAISIDSTLNVGTDVHLLLVAATND